MTCSELHHSQLLSDWVSFFIGTEHWAKRRDGVWVLASAFCMRCGHQLELVIGDIEEEAA